MIRWFLSDSLFLGLFLGALGVVIPIIMAVSLIVANASEKEMRKHLGWATSDIVRTVFVRISLSVTNNFA